MLCLDPGDVFDRRALIAAAAGTAVAAAPLGAVHAVLGAELVEIEEAAIASAVGAVLERAPGRAARRGTVLEACSSPLMLERLAALVAAARQDGAGIISRLEPALH